MFQEGGGLTYDGVLTLLGEFGRYQKWLCLLLCLPAMSGGIQILITVFTLAVPDHRSVQWPAAHSMHVQHTHANHVMQHSVSSFISSLCHSLSLSLSLSLSVYIYI